jgi:hypothetical protein
MALRRESSFLAISLHAAGFLKLEEYGKSRGINKKLDVKL